MVQGLLERCPYPPPGTAVRCGVSGGADSLALLILGVAAGCEVTAVHVDHGLRPGSAREAEVVAEAAARVGAHFEGTRVELAAGPNLEARAREARRRALGPDALTGHTADDQAETVLLNVLRGAALDGLAGYDPATRPIRHLRRTETAALCAELAFDPVVDPTNEDRSLRRNRIRHEVLPLLAEAAERDLVPVLARQAELLREDARLLDEQAAAIDPTDCAALRDAPGALARRALRRWLRSGAEQHPPGAADLERVLAVVRGEVRACELPGGRRVTRRAGRLRLEP